MMAILFGSSAYVSFVIYDMTAHTYTRTHAQTLKYTVYET